MADYFHWRSLTTAINKLPAVETFLLDRVFKDPTNSEQHFSDSLDIDVIVGKKRLAPFVSKYEAGKVVSGTTRELQTVKFPRLRPKKFLPAGDLLLERGAGMKIYAGPGDVNEAVRRKIALELQDLKNSIKRTIEWMAAQALQGTLVVEQDNIAFQIDFRIPASNKPVLTDTAAWNGTDSNPVEDIKTWKRLIYRKTGLVANMAIIGYEAADALLSNEAVQKLLDNRRMAVGQLNLTNTNYIGTLAGVDIFEYPEAYEDESGNEHDYVDPKKFILFAPGANFRVHYGMIIDLGEESGGQQAPPVAMPFFSKSWLEKDPSGRWLLAESDPLPVPHWPEAIVVATVLE